jgi:hypothetical protein
VSSCRSSGKFSDVGGRVPVNQPEDGYAQKIAILVSLVELCRFATEVAGDGPSNLAVTWTITALAVIVWCGLVNRRQ